MDSENQVNNAYLIDLVNQRIEALRPKLLDVSKRNPLISTKFSERSNTLIRVVDEIPTILFEKLSASKKMTIVSLPKFTEDPKDEDTREFQSALAEARVSDDLYLKRVDNVNQESSDAAESLVRAERELKDRLRKKLEMSARQNLSTSSLRQHAIQHGIRPDWELPTENDNHQDGRHTDDQIQTLLLPDVLERRLNALVTKDNTWKQETGINVLHAAFGFLEWAEKDTDTACYSPLVLLPVEIERKRAKNGLKFDITGNGDIPESNTVLAEMFRINYGIDFPLFSGESLEEYFAKLQSVNSIHITKWKIHRWVTIGVLPSSRLAMYNDLETSKWNFIDNPIITALFGGSDAGVSEIPFGDEYDIDNPEIESKVPYLITDADSSQFSTIVDVIDGKNIAVEGPPGTGKSQTIVNTIAAALGDGKKVLFVAEKSAALEVVRSRLDAFGIGDFILPLQATRASKEIVIDSIRKRLEMTPCPNPKLLDVQISKFKKIRSELTLYIQTISAKFGNTDQTVYRIIGRNIATRNHLDQLPDSIKRFRLPETEKLTLSSFQEIEQLCDRIVKLWFESNQHDNSWKGVQIYNSDPSKIEESLNLSSKTSQSFLECFNKLHELEPFGISSETNLNKLFFLKEKLENITFDPKDLEVQLANKLVSSENLAKFSEFLDRTEAIQKMKANLEAIIQDVFQRELPEKLTNLSAQIQKYPINDFSEKSLKSEKENRLQLIAELNQALEFLQATSQIFPEAEELHANYIVCATDILSQTSKGALAMRCESLTNPLSLEILKKSEKIATGLKERQADLQQYFIISPCPEAQDILKHASVLLNSNMFSFISKHFRDAKRFFKVISKDTKFKRKDAAHKLQNLGAWISELQSFELTSGLKELLGKYYKGIESNFETSLEVASFYTAIDKTLGGADPAELRAFLRSADYETLLSLPVATPEHPIRTMRQFKLAKGQIQLKMLKEEFEEVCLLIKCIEEVEPTLLKSKWSTDELNTLSKQLETFQKEWTELNEYSVIKALLEDDFFGAETKKESFKKTVQIAMHLDSLPIFLRKIFLESLEKKNHRNLLEKLCILETMHITSQELLTQLKQLSGINWLEKFKSDNPQDLAILLKKACQDKVGLLTNARLFNAKNELKNRGFGAFIEGIFECYQEPCELTKLVRAIIITSMVESIWKEQSNILVRFDGEKLSNLRQQLATLDKEIILLSRDRLQHSLYFKSKHPSGIGIGPRSQWTETALLTHQINLQQRYAPIRELTKRAANALIELKPCWMMSPLSVAQYIPKGSITFDLVIIDEASQMTPEDSIGALVRGKQVMVVGDTNQLPPSAFFKKIIDDGSDDSDDDLATNEESILEMANATFKPKRRLRWHYRSRHSSLIAFSNKHIYKNDLVIFPSAKEQDPNQGVAHVKVNGRYSSGINPEEAKAIIDAAVEFMRVDENRPKANRRSLGIVALNQKQSTLIEEEMNYAEQQYPWVSSYKEYWKTQNNGLEYFFIKNLENVQGDERDVIFIGTVYGPEQPGAKVMQRFGPINGISGKRRLNVLFSRAKHKIVTFSSMTPADIHAEDTTNPGVNMLKQWLEYSANGYLETGKICEKEPDSEFEEFVMDQINAMGCEAIPQIGVTGYSIDIGVKHPDWPYGFIMGVECDGASYHSSRSARDRDRLRQEVLEGLGWHLHRIWSTDWFEDPRREIEKLRLAIKDRLETLSDTKKRQEAQLISQ